MFRKFLLNYQLKLDKTIKNVIRYQCSVDLPPDSEVTPKKKRETSDKTASSEVLKFYRNNDESDIISKFPAQLAKKKQNYDNMYMVNPHSAQQIGNFVTDDRIPIFEVNPGLGFLTRILLEKTNSPIHCFEPLREFKKHMEEVFMENIDRMNYIDGDFFKMSLRDSMDHQNRLLQYFPTEKEWNEDPVLKVIGTTGTKEFFKHIIKSLIYQDHLFSRGRIEFLLAVPSHIFLYFICNNKAGYFCYRPSSVLFQILFEYEILDLIPRKDYLPWQMNLRKTSKFQQMFETHSDFLYLTRIVPRKDLFELISRDQLTALSFFVKQYMSAGRRRIIPHMEKWMTNSGIRLIMNDSEKKIGQSTTMSIGNEGVTFPDFVNKCEKITTDPKLLPNINIFTSFDELTPSEIFLLFKEMVSWPGYQDSIFVASMLRSELEKHRKRDLT